MGRTALDRTRGSDVKPASSRQKPAKRLGIDRCIRTRRLGSDRVHELCGDSVRGQEPTLAQSVFEGVEGHDVSELKQKLEEHDVNARSEQGNTALMRTAANNSNPEVTQSSLDAGSSTTARTLTGRIPLGTGPGSGVRIIR
jgi:hypothetical protein